MEIIRKQKRGISLIVLIITIVVMVILASAIILSISDERIINKAEEGASSSDLSKKRQAAQTHYSSWQIAKELNKTDETALEYVQSKLKSDGIVDVSDVAFDSSSNQIIVGTGGRAINLGVQLGATVTGYDISNINFTTDGKEASGETSSGVKFEAKDSMQNIKANTSLTWKYIGIDDDGNMLIAADISEEISNDEKVTLRGQGGYVYGSDSLNRVCKALYSTSKGTARSINIEDILKILDYAGHKGGYYDTNGNAVTTLHPLAIGKINSDLNLSKWTSTYTPSNINTWEEISRYTSNAFSINKSDITDEIKKSIVFYDNEYWIASTAQSATFAQKYVEFGMRKVNNDEVGFDCVFTSIGDCISKTKAIRPVVVLNSNVFFTYDKVNNICTLK